MAQPSTTPTIVGQTSRKDHGSGTTNAGGDSRTAAGDSCTDNDKADEEQSPDGLLLKEVGNVNSYFYPILLATSQRLLSACVRGGFDQSFSSSFEEKERKRLVCCSGCIFTALCAVRVARTNKREPDRSQADLQQRACLYTTARAKGSPAEWACHGSPWCRPARRVQLEGWLVLDPGLASVGIKPFQFPPSSQAYTDRWCSRRLPAASRARGPSGPCHRGW